LEHGNMTVRQQLVEHYRWLRQYGLNDSHSGNASVRVGDLVWITPTGSCADTLAVNELICFDLNDAPPAGASQDAPLHRSIYRNNPQARAVLHSHCPHAIALTMNGDDYVPVDFEGQLYFPRVPVVSIAHGDYFAESPGRIGSLLSQYPVAIVRGHGVYTWGETVNQAYKWSCSLELSARTGWLARQAGTL
jgi:L-fuculose-phosphate aldolase